MDQTQQELTDEKTASEPIQRTSIGLKLTLISVGMLFVAFIVYAIISIRIGQGSLLTSLEEDMQAQTNETNELIRIKLLEARTIASNLATAVETGTYGSEDLQQIIQNTVLRNEQIYGATAGYEPYQFNPTVYYWSPYYNRTPENSLQYTQLGDFDYFNQEWYFLPKRSLSPTLSPPYRDNSRGNIWIATWSIPFYDRDGNLRGIAAADIEFSKIQETFVNIRIGQTGYAFLLDSNGTILGIGDKDEDYEPMFDSMYAVANSNIADNWLELVNNMTSGQTGFMEVTDLNNDPMYISYAPVGLDTDWSLALVYPREELIQQTRQLQTTLIGYSFVLALFFGVVIFYFTRTVTNPLVKLTRVAEEISGGNLHVTAPVESYDEVGTLAEAINRMTDQLQDTLTNLERRIAERTMDLEVSRHQTEERAAQLFSIGEISKIINAEQELTILLPLITRLVSERFNFYHTGIFLIDDARQHAVLLAANSLGGQNMLKRGHKLKVGESGIVGFVAKSGIARIALDVGQDAVFFNNPDLPNTRSEIALPLKAREKVIGILDVQSEKPGAFTPEDANILGILADQVAIAIENTKLLEQTKLALEEARSAYQQNLQEGWKNFGREEGMIGYYQSVSGGRKLERPLNNDEINQAMYRGEVLVFHADGKTSDPTLVVPIKLRDQIIGVMHIKAPSRERQWTTSEVNLTEAVAERLSLALENARLIQESQRQVIKEQTITEITGKIGSSVNLENVLLTAVEELGRTIPGSEVTIKLKNENKNNGNSSRNES
jgi:GAF domain-containing protein/HAMP domain-containing protein